jgi:hypothetical protein
MLFLHLADFLRSGGYQRLIVQLSIDFETFSFGLLVASPSEARVERLSRQQCLRISGHCCRWHGIAAAAAAGC